MIPKTEIYFATRKTASAHVYITKGVGKVRINNVPVEMIPQETAREVILAPLEITGDLREKIDISVRVRGGGFICLLYTSPSPRARTSSRMPSSA